MHPTILATQRGQALAQIDKASKLLAEQLQLDLSVLAGLHSQAKDPQVKELHRLQGVASLLEILVKYDPETYKPSKPDSTDEIPTDRIETAVKTGPVSETSSQADVTAVTAGADAPPLPPPVIDEPPTKSKPEGE